MANELGLFRNGSLVSSYSSSTDLNAAASTFLPGDEVRIADRINIGHVPIQVVTRGTSDNPFVITSSGGYLENYTDLLDTGVFTWEEVPTWVGNELGGAVVQFNGVYYTAIANTGASNPETDTTNWKNVNGKTYQILLPAAYKQQVQYVEVDGSPSYARRQVGLNDATTNQYEWRRVGEWAIGGPGHNQGAEAPDYFYIRSDTIPTNEFTTLIGSFGFGAIYVLADGSATPNHCLIEDLYAERCGRIVVARTYPTRTEDLRGFTMRRVRGNRIGFGAMVFGYSETVGGDEYSVREWSIDDCKFDIVGVAGVRATNAGIGSVNGVEVNDFSLQQGHAGIYVTGQKNPSGESFDVPDPVYVTKCMVTQANGLYNEQAGIGNMWNDHGDAYYHDSGGTNAHFISNHAHTIPASTAALCRANSSGSTYFVNMSSENVNMLMHISNSTGGVGNEVYGYQISGKGLSYSSAILVKPNADAAIVLQGLAIEGTGTYYLENQAALGDCSIDVTDVRHQGYAGSTGDDIAESNVNGAGADIFGTGVEPTSLLLEKGTVDPYRIAPRIDLSEPATDRLQSTHNITRNDEWGIAFTLTHEDLSVDTLYAWTCGATNNDHVRGQRNTAGNLSIIKRYDATTYVGPYSQAQAVGVENSFFLRHSASSEGNSLFVNGVKRDPSGDSDDVNSSTIVDEVWKWASNYVGAGGQGAPIQLRDVMFVEGVVSDEEGIELSK